jgi:hypothetical protein
MPAAGTNHTRRNSRGARLPPLPDQGAQARVRAMMNENRNYTLKAQLACVKREIALRKSVYPTWVLRHKMKPETADHELNCMQAVHDTLATLLCPKPSP